MRHRWKWKPGVTDDLSVPSLPSMTGASPVTSSSTPSLHLLLRRWSSPIKREITHVMNSWVGTRSARVESILYDHHVTIPKNVISYSLSIFDQVMISELSRKEKNNIPIVLWYISVDRCLCRPIAGSLWKPRNLKKRWKKNARDASKYKTCLKKYAL